MDKAQAAKNLLMDEFFMGEVQSIKDGCLREFQNSRADDIEARESAYMRLQAINQIVSHFEAIAADKAITQKRWKIL